MFGISHHTENKSGIILPITNLDPHKVVPHNINWLLYYGAASLVVFGIAHMIIKILSLSEKQITSEWNHGIIS